MRTEGRKPVLIVIAGPNGSGKTSVTSKILQHEWMEDSVYINPDIVAQEKFGDWNSMEAIKKAVVYCEEWREKCLVERKSKSEEGDGTSSRFKSSYSHYGKPSLQSKCKSIF